jgi:broad specificity phosphatase PhoE
MVRLVLIRHGLTKWNITKRYCGRRDIGLSDEGKAQAELLSKRFSPDEFDKVYSSDRKRAMQTAGILFRNKEVVRDKGLREIDFGVFEGLRHEEIMEKYSRTYQKWLKDPFTNDIAEAESMSKFRERVESAISNIVRSNSGKTIAVVCHGGVIGIYVRGMLRREGFWSCVPSSASTTTVEYDKGKAKLKKFNDTTHLKVAYE